MKGKSTVKIGLLVVFLSVALYIGDMFLGNPISYGIVKWHSQRYLQETYPQWDLRVDSIYHDWYSGGGYNVRVVSDTSRDTRFELAYGRLGKLHWDGYEMMVASGRSTLSRLYDEYDALVADALKGVYDSKGRKAGLYVVDEYTGEPGLLSVGIDMAQLELDADYDVAALGTQYGYLDVSLYVAAEDLNTEVAAQRLLEIKRAMETAGVGYARIDLFMTVEDGKDPNASLGIHSITPADLEAENVPARLEEVRLEQLDYWNGPKTE
ncbi:MAG: hypothetical protein IKA16_02515 [Oscillospiraceae bacterium]|nr:hypothetical protein [Oscillospiraceae bacterium]